VFVFQNNINRQLIEPRVRSVISLLLLTQESAIPRFNGIIIWQSWTLPWTWVCSYRSPSCIAMAKLAYSWVQNSNSHPWV